MKNWELANAEEKAAAHPRSFFIPSLEERLALWVGDVVQLHFILLTDPGPGSPGAERMWVEIQEKTLDPLRFIGVLTNQPAYITGLNRGDLITFGPEHVACILVDPIDPGLAELSEKTAIVSRFVFEESGSIRWMYREAVPSGKDSGWRMFNGDEPEEYVDNPSNCRVCNIGWLIDFDPTLLPSLLEPPGAAFERASRSDAWVKVADWTPPDD